MPKSAAADPFADFAAPSASDCRRVAAALVAVHGQPKLGADVREADCGGVEVVVEALVRTILSQNTTNQNSHAAMQTLMQHFGGDFDKICEAPPAQVVACLRRGGLANIKTRRIQALLGQIKQERGRISLEHLRHLPDAQLHQQLVRFDGVGHKTASCVALFCLGRASMAVDTHVHRLARALGWAPMHASRDQMFFHLQRRVPAPLKYPLHVLLVRHGQTCRACRAGGAGATAQALPPCPLGPFKVGARQPPLRGRRAS